MQKLGDYIKEYSARNKQNEDIPVYSVTNSNGFCRDYFGKEVASSNKKTYKIVPRNAFAYNPSRINVGSVDYQHYEDRVIVSPLYNVFTVDERVVPEYLYFYLKNPNTIKRIKAVASGSVRDNLKLSMLYEFPISLPSVSNQKTIVKTINKVQAVIDSKKSALEKLDNLIKARFVEMFNGDYEEVELSELGKISTGSTPPMKNKDFYENADMPFYKPGDFIDGVSNIDCSESFVDARAESVSRIMDPGAVAVTCIGIIGKIGIIKRRGICNQQINFIAPNDNVNSIYLAYAIDTKKRFMQEKANAPVVPILNKTNFSKVTIPFAPVELQNQFAAFVARVDKSKFALGNELAMGNFYIRLIYDRIMHGRVDL